MPSEVLGDFGSFTPMTSAAQTVPPTIRTDPIGVSLDGRIRPLLTFPQLPQLPLRRRHPRRLLLLHPPIPRLLMSLLTRPSPTGPAPIFPTGLLPRRPLNVASPSLSSSNTFRASMRVNYCSPLNSMTMTTRRPLTSCSVWALKAKS